MCELVNMDGITNINSTCLHKVHKTNCLSFGKRTDNTQGKLQSHSSVKSKKGDQSRPLKWINTALIL